MISSGNRAPPPPPSHDGLGALSLGDCPNCGANLRGPFCSQCGEKKLRREDYTLREVAGDVIGEFTHFDGRLIRTIVTLIRRPGELARAYFHGGRSRYTKPLTLFVIINLAFFFIQPHTGLLRYGLTQFVYPGVHSGTYKARLVEAKLKRTGEPEDKYAIRFNAVLQDQKKSLLIFSIPVVAALMLVLFRGSGRTYVEHLVFSVHLYTFVLLYLTSLVILFIVVALFLSAFGATGRQWIHLLGSELQISVLMGAGLTVYTYHAARRVYGARGLWMLVRAATIAASVGYLTGVYHDVLFYATYWST